MNTTTETTPPKRRTLFEITQQLIAALDESGGEITPAIDNLGLDLRDKAEAYRAVILQYEAECRANKEAAEWYAARASAKCKAAARLEERLRDAMLVTGQHQIKTATCTAHLRSSKSVWVQDEAAFCLDAADRFVTVKTSPNKREIKLAIEAGEPVDGASIVENFSVMFR